MKYTPDRLTSLVAPVTLPNAGSVVRTGSVMLKRRVRRRSCSMANRQFQLIPELA